MTEENPNHVQHAPRRRTDALSVAEFTMMVRVPEQPGAIRVFTDAETDEALRYATDEGGTVVPLPLAPTPSALNEHTVAGSAGE